MTTPNDATILELAKLFCEQNGTAWSVEFGADNRVSRGRAVLDDRDRRRYLARAREQLLRDGESLAAANNPAGR
jgi:hypothetical protein